MKLRMHRGGIDDSMKTEITVYSKEALYKAVRRELNLPEDYDLDEHLRVSLYYDQTDTRINWLKTYIVQVPGNIVGFADSTLDTLLDFEPTLDQLRQGVRLPNGNILTRTPEGNLPMVMSSTCMGIHPTGMETYIRKVVPK